MSTIEISPMFPASRRTIAAIRRGSTARRLAKPL